MSTEIEAIVNKLNVGKQISEVLESRGTDFTEKKVIALDLSSLKISSLPDGIFDNLSDLERLNLGYNNLSEVNPSVFSKLSKLTFLSLYANQLSEIQDDFLKAFPNLEWLDLRFNHLTKIPKSVLDLKKLVYLYLQNNADLTSDEYDFSQDYHSKRDVGKFAEQFRKSRGIAPAETPVKKTTKKATANKETNKESPSKKEESSSG